MLFSWFWTSQFIVAAGQLVVAMSISTWYVRAAEAGRRRGWGGRASEDR
jgi:hypothetical protein